MKTRLFSLIGGICFCGLAFTQVNVPIVNPGFELPKGGAKIMTLDNGALPGWFSDTSYNNTGREANSSATEGAMIGFSSNIDGTVAQVVDKIADVPNIVTYVLTFDANLTWTPGSASAAKVYTKLSAYSGIDRKSRVVVDSMAFSIIYGWQRFNQVVEFEANSSYAGDSLVIEYDVYGSEVDSLSIPKNTWVQVDNFKLKKYNGVYTGKNIIPLQNPSFELPTGAAKIITLDNGALPGWFSDTSYNNTGRETSGGATDGAMIGFSSNIDGTVAQVVDVIADLPQAATYVLSFDGNLTWTPGAASAARVYTLFSAYSGSDRKTRVVIDSLASPLINGWQSYSHSVEIAANSIYAGDSLVIEYDVYGSEVDSLSISKNTWVQVDNFKLTKYTEGETILYPIANLLSKTNHIDANDFSGDLSAHWDADSIYMQFAIVDDSIVNVGASYQVDNIEIYFDMDNSKNIHWPRNGGWVKAVDDAIDTNDWQLRLVPDVDFDVNNTARPAITEGYHQIYSRTANGYYFELNVAWNELLEGFVPEAGKIFGFDVNASDNDAVASDANRDQISLNSPTLGMFNDPSLWASIEIGPYGQFVGLPSDKTSPAVPAGLDTVSTDTSKINLKWTPSKDQASAVLNYIVYKNDVKLATVYPAAPATATYNATGLTPNTEYTFKVVAVDNYGNQSAASATKTFKTKAKPVINAIDNVELSFNKVYPNPSTGIFSLETSELGMVSFNVFDVTGAIVKSGIFTNNYKLDLSNFSNGMYILNVKSDQKSEIIKLIVK
jgi:hypothetical protein